jgi:hypothetical protein
MASQITHVVLAKKISDDLFNKFDQAAFLIGTIFPDIQYLKVIEREKTHFKNLSFKNVLKEENSFVAGMKYHSLVDEIREKYMIEKGIYTLIPSSRFVTQALKAYEDEVLYSNGSDWSIVITYLNTLLPEEIGLVEKVDKVKTWHSLMQEYFKKPPADISRKNFILRFGFSEDIANEINGLISEMRQDSKIRGIILNFYENWNLLIKSEN